MGLLPRKFVLVVRCKPIRTSGQQSSAISRSSLIAAGQGRGNIGYRQMGRIQKGENNPMHSSRQELRRRSMASREIGWQRRLGGRNFI
jgi:hypothetical protein